jgi:hypothetical protein
MKRKISIGLLAVVFATIASASAILFPTVAFPAYTGDTFDYVAAATPLNTALWTNVGSLPSEDEIEVKSDVATTSITVQCDGQAINKTVLPNNQYVAVVANQLTALGAVNFYVNAGAGLAPSYNMTIIGPLNVQKDAQYFIDQFDPTGGTFTHVWASNVPISILPHDQIALVVNHTRGKIEIWKNGSVITGGSYNLSDSPVQLSGGSAGLQLDSGSSPCLQSDVGVTHFLAGPSS